MLADTDTNRKADFSFSATMLGTAWGNSTGYIRHYGTEKDHTESNRATYYY
jgi:hypothetical protein